ncbi:MAG: SDR family oxidoreductase [Chloroflexota bacterium]
MEAYLVTGGAGFIGSNIVEELLSRGEAVRVLDNFSGGKRENLDFVSDYPKGNYELIEGDIREPDTCRRACRGMGYVLHQAALRSVPLSIEQPLPNNEVNITGTLNMLMAAKEAGVKRLVYASSSSVYGDSARLPQQETQTPSPISPYAVTKLAGEHYCRVFSQVYGLETCALRYFNVFGPRQDPASQYAAIVPRFILSALRGEPLEIHGDGQQSRDFTYVSNVVEANLIAARAAKASGEAVNIACGEQHSVLDVAEAIAEIAGRKPEHHHTPPRPGDIRHSLADISKAGALLGYKQRVTFIDGLRQTVSYFQSLKRP